MPEIPRSRSGKPAVGVATEVVAKAGALLLERAHSIKQVDYKGRGNIVTDVDRQSEELIIGMLLDEFPGYGIHAEESGKQASPSEYAWVIDPLDGTKNYSMGLPVYNVTIALARGSEVLVGATFDPNRHELFTAERGGGAFLNGARLRVSEQTSLRASLVGTDMGYRDDLGHYALQMWNALWPGMQGIRIMGSSALSLAYLAAGRIDIYTHHFLYPWDIAAGVLLVQEAGGIVTSRNGTPIDFLRDPGIIAANPAIHKDFLALSEGMTWRSPPEPPTK